MTGIEATLSTIHSYRCQIRHATRDLWECKDDLELEIDRLQFLKTSQGQRRFAKAYAKRHCSLQDVYWAL